MKIKTAHCRYGKFLYFDKDTFVGRSLDLYGEFSEGEVFVYQSCLKSNDAAVVVGGNIGALIVPLARHLSEGQVIAYEPQPANCSLLRENLTINDIGNVVVRQYAAGAENGFAWMKSLETLGHNNYGASCLEQAGDLRVAVETIDDLQLDRLNFIQIDAEGSELVALSGAEKTIRRHRPIIYCENDRQEKSAELIGWLIDHGYRCFWHMPPLFNSNNFRGAKHNVFGSIVSRNMLCVPTDVRDAEGYFEVKGLDEVGDLRIRPDMYEREAKRFAIEVEHHPKDMTARLLLAHNLSLTGKTEEARQLIEENLKISPDHASTQHIKGMLDLQAGNYADGWYGYEQRYRIKREAQYHFGGSRHFDATPWDGQKTNKKLMISCEQGFGDNIMFARFMKNVLMLAPNAMLETQPQLYELFELSNLSPRGLYRRGRTLPTFDLQCSLPSLPYVLKLHDEEQLRASPYLKAEPTMVEAWKQRLDRIPFKIGVCYRGSPRSERPWSRDIDPAVIDPVLQDYGPLINLTQEGQFESFADTAACLSALDLVISVDTSMAHLAGALGTETFLLLSTDPDWRWKLSTDRTCWYETMHIFRQKQFMDWGDVVEKVIIALRESLTAYKNGRRKDG